MSIVKRNKSTIFGLTAELTALNSAVSTETTNRTQALVDEAAARAAALQVVSDAGLKKASNLSDLADKVVARTNLGVASSAEVTAQITDAIDDAKLALGTNHSVTNIAGRDALANLDLDDRVFVADDGDSKWAIYKPFAIDGTGAVTSWTKLSDQDSLENSISAPAIKAAYESNDDVNAFTDAEKAKLAIALTSALLAQDLAVSALATEAPSAEAVKRYVDSRPAAQSVAAVQEGLVVAANDTITLSAAPLNGVAGVMNFGTVRFTDENGNAFDAPLIATADTKVFTVSTDTAGQWTGFTVQVQYLRAA